MYSTTFNTRKQEEPMKTTKERKNGRKTKLGKSFSSQEKREFQGHRSATLGQMLQRDGDRRGPNGSELKHESCKRVSLEWGSEPEWQVLREQDSEGTIRAVCAYFT